NGDTAASLETPPALWTPASATSHVGVYPIAATGAASGDYEIGFGEGTLTVTQAPTALALSFGAGASPAAVAGQAAPLIATVTTPVTGAGVPAGTVTFFDCGAALGTASLDAAGKA